jgi:hypothetical protein
MPRPKAAAATAGAAPKILGRLSKAISDERWWPRNTIMILIAFSFDYYVSHPFRLVSSPPPQRWTPLQRNLSFSLVLLSLIFLSMHLHRYRSGVYSPIFFMICANKRCSEFQQCINLKIFHRMPFKMQVFALTYKARYILFIKESQLKVLVNVHALFQTMHSEHLCSGVFLTWNGWWMTFPAWGSVQVRYVDFIAANIFLIQSNQPRWLSQLPKSWIIFAVSLAVHCLQLLLLAQRWEEMSWWDGDGQLRLQRPHFLARSYSTW